MTSARAEDDFAERRERIMNELLSCPEDVRDAWKDAPREQWIWLFEALTELAVRKDRYFKALGGIDVERVVSAKGEFTDSAFRIVNELDRWLWMVASQRARAEMDEEAR